MTAPQIWSRPGAAYAAAVVGIFVANAATRAARLITAILTRMIEKLKLSDEGKEYIDATVKAYKDWFREYLLRSLDPSELLMREQKRYYRATFDKTFTNFNCFQAGGKYESLGNGAQFFDWFQPFEPEGPRYPDSTMGKNRLAEYIELYVIKGMELRFEPYTYDPENDFLYPDPPYTISVPCDGIALWVFYKWLEPLTLDSPELAPALAVEDDPPPRPLYLQLLKEVLAVPEDGPLMEYYADVGMVVPLRNGNDRSADNVKGRVSDWKSGRHSFTLEDIALVVSELRAESRTVNEQLLAAIRRSSTPK